MSYRYILDFKNTNQMYITLVNFQQNLFTLYMVKYKQTSEI